MLGYFKKLFVFKSLLTTLSNVLPLHFNETFLPIIWIFTEGDGIESRLPSKIFSTLLERLCSSFFCNVDLLRCLWDWQCFHNLCSFLCGHFSPPHISRWGHEAVAWLLKLWTNFPRKDDGEQFFLLKKREKMKIQYVVTFLNTIAKSKVRYTVPLQWSLRVDAGHFLHISPI